nr:MAG TPA: hypothetical protein [Bacteriophage sp.]
MIVRVWRGYNRIINFFYRESKHFLLINFYSC